MTDLEDQQDIKTPENYSLLQNYPNPFNGETTIEFQVSHESNVKLEIFDVLGQKVKTLVDEQKLPGFYSISWDSRNNDGKTMNSGVYFIRFIANNFSEVKKMMLLK